MTTQPSESISEDVVTGEPGSFSVKVKKILTNNFAVGELNNGLQSGSPIENAKIGFNPERRVLDGQVKANKPKRKKLRRKNKRRRLQNKTTTIAPFQEEQSQIPADNVQQHGVARRAKRQSGLVQLLQQSRDGPQTSLFQVDPSLIHVPEKKSEEESVETTTTKKPKIKRRRKNRTKPTEAPKTNGDLDGQTTTQQSVQIT